MISDLRFQISETEMTETDWIYAPRLEI